MRSRTLKSFKFEIGFTLIELLIVITIISLLSSIILAALIQAKDKAGVATAVTEVKEIEKSLTYFFYDTQSYQARCMSDDPPVCTAANDPMLVDNGIVGWKGPYLSSGSYNLTDRWGGQIGFEPIPDAPGFLIFLNDDRPGTSQTDNGGQIPTVYMQAIDKILDDGNLSTGNMRSGPTTFHFVGLGTGEMTLIYLP